MVDFSGDSLSTFASEQELATGRSAGSARTDAPGLRSRGQLIIIVALVLVALAQAGLIAWWWTSGGTWPTPAPPTARLSINSEPAGAAVRIDGVPRGTTPFAVELDSGRHDVSVGADLSPWTQTIDVAPGERTSIHVVQSSAAAVGHAVGEKGTLEITTDPAGLAVTVDGQARGVSPVSVTDLEPGTHEVAVTRGASVVRRVVSVEAGVPTAVVISTAAGGIPSGWLTVTGVVPVQIQEDGTLLGSSDTPRLLLPVGRHELDFVNETFGYRARRTVQIVAGQAASIALEPASGTLSVNAQPWAEVWIDGKRIGETPIGNLPLTIGNHELVVRHPQLGERRRTVAVSANVPARVGIDLRQ